MNEQQMSNLFTLPANTTFTSHIQKRNKRKLHGSNKTLKDVCLAPGARLSVSVVQLSYSVNCIA